MYISPRLTQQCLINQYHAKATPKRFQSLRHYGQNLNVRFRVAIYCGHRRISSHRFSPAKRSDNPIYVCVCRLGLLLFKKKKKLTFHWPCISQFSYIFLSFLIFFTFFHSIWWWLKEFPAKKNDWSLKGLLTLFSLALSLTLPRSTIFHDCKKPCFC